MDDAHALPTDLAECQQLLLAVFQRAAELSRVLDETAASYEQLQATHQAALTVASLNGASVFWANGELGSINPNRAS